MFSKVSMSDDILVLCTYIVVCVTIFIDVLIMLVLLLVLFAILMLKCCRWSGGSHHGDSEDSKKSRLDNHEASLEEQYSTFPSQFSGFHPTLRAG